MQEYLASQTSHVHLLFKMRGVTFQMRVWEERRRIPHGRSVSYSELSARACATNPVAILIPCHRVIRQTGELGEYGGGIERMRTLLEKEREQRG